MKYSATLVNKGTMWTFQLLYPLLIRINHDSPLINIDKGYMHYNNKISSCCMVRKYSKITVEGIKRRIPTVITSKQNLLGWVLRDF